VSGHEHHDHADDHDHEHDEEAAADISSWAASAPTTTCPACGASGAVMLGGGVFCPTCREVSTNPGYQPPAEPAED
jgi:hypothetical protein